VAARDYDRDLVEHPLHLLLARVNAARRNGTQAASDGERALEQAFRCSQRLAVYGTLAPGEANAHILAACPGTWSLGEVHGRRALRDYPVFTYAHGAGVINMQVLHSQNLPEHWSRIDEFEGGHYCRILVPVFEGRRLLTIANLYEARDPIAP
jgi:gamma-glutamylcyclotransferase (GGCT)/AIG2-like uncharacterized protein YtfP